MSRDRVRDPLLNYRPRDGSQGGFPFVSNRCQSLLNEGFRPTESDTVLSQPDEPRKSVDRESLMIKTYKELDISSVPGFKDQRQSLY